MLNAHASLLHICSKLCWHNVDNPTPGQSLPVSSIVGSTHNFLIFVAGDKIIPLPSFNCLDRSCIIINEVKLMETQLTKFAFQSMPFINK